MTNIYPATPIALFGGLVRHKELLWELVKRDFLGRYRGSMFAIVRSLFNPSLMQVIYTVIIGVTFQGNREVPR